MIGSEIENLLLENQSDFLISADKVAHVMDTNPLTHALLVLSKVRYSKIPVLNAKDELVGFIGLTNIVDEMFDLDEVDPDNLNDKKVSDVMDNDITFINDIYDVERLFHLAVDHPFIPVSDKNNKFMGIVTRKELLKAVNHLIHTLGNDYDLKPKKVEVRKFG